MIVAGRLQRGGDLRRVVPVVVEDPDAASLAHELEAPVDAGEPGESAFCLRPGRLRRARAPRARRRHSGGCARPAPRARRRTAPARGHVRPTAPVASQSSKKLSSSASEANVAWWSSSTFVRTAISGRRSCDRAVRLVALDHEPARARPGVPAELGHDAPDDPGRVGAELAEHEGDHRRGRRLAVGAPDDDRPPKRRRARRGARPAGGPRRARMGGRDDDLESGRRRRLATDVDGDPVERLHEDRLAEVPAAYLRPPRARDVRVRREPRAPDTDEVDPPALERPVAHDDRSRSAARRAARARRRSSAAASGRASARIASLILRRRSGSSSSSSTRAGTRCELLLAHDDRPAALLEVNGVEELVVGRRMRVRDEDRRRPGGGQLPDRATRSRDREVGAASASPNRCTLGSST